MPLTKWNIAGALLGLALVAAPCVAQETEDKGAQVGKKVDSAIESLKKGAREAGDAIREQYEKARTSIHNMGVASRVYGRLHWDKLLTDCTIDVDVRRDGVATLKGTVGSAAARAKAVDLTRDTVGVTSVVDQLAIGPVSPSPAPVTTKPAVKP